MGASTFEFVCPLTPANTAIHSYAQPNTHPPCSYNSLTKQQPPPGLDGGGTGGQTDRQTAEQTSTIHPGCSNDIIFYEWKSAPLTMLSIHDIFYLCVGGHPDNDATRRLSPFQECVLSTQFILYIKDLLTFHSPNNVTFIYYCALAVNILYLPKIRKTTTTSTFHESWRWSEWLQE